MAENSRRLNGIKAVFFDLDGTLLQVEMRQFVPCYIQGLANCFTDRADRKKFADVVLAATFALLHSDGTRTNRELFLAALEVHLGIPAALFEQRLRAYCGNGMHDLAALVRPHPLVQRILQACFDRGLKVVIATNPVFPRPLVDARLQWGGLWDFPFDLVTSYENSRFCKPHPGYFTDILDALGLAPEECLMVGNDPEHDMSAHRTGIATFLLDTWLIERSQTMGHADFQGGHGELCQFVERLPPVGEELT